MCQPISVSRPATVGPLLPTTSLPPIKPRAFLPRGPQRFFALLISFDDYPSTVSSDTIDEMLWGGGNPSHYPRESLANYYGRSSYGYRRSEIWTHFRLVSDFLCAVGGG